MLLVTTARDEILRHIVAVFFYTSEFLLGILLLLTLGWFNWRYTLESRYTTQSVNPTFPGIRHPTLRNTESFCLRCHSKIHWNATGNPKIMQFGNENLKFCLKHGCSLVFYKFDTYQSDTIFALLTPAHC